MAIVFISFLGIGKFNQRPGYDEKRLFSKEENA